MKMKLFGMWNLKKEEEEEDERWGWKRKRERQTIIWWNEILGEKTEMILEKPETEWKSQNKRLEKKTKFDEENDDDEKREKKRRK